MLPRSQRQEEMLDFALTRDACGIFAKPGAGKTRVALDIIDQTDRPALIVAPDLVCVDTWPAEIEKWNFSFTSRYLHGKEKNLNDLPHISLINYHGLPWLADQLKRQKCPWDLIVYDELSKMKHPGSSRFRKWRNHMKKFQYRIGMTGSPDRE